MDELGKVAIVLAIFAIILAFTTPVLAQGSMRGGTTMPMERSNKDMVAALTGTKDTSMAASIMKKSGLEGMVTPEGKYTLFVASDTALKATSPGVMNRMMEKLKDRQFATYFVKGHMVNGMVMPNEMTDGKALAMMNGKTMQVRVTGGRMMVDDATITKAVETNNGMIYVMDKIPSSVMAMVE